jgi:hypothetical protein
LGYEKTDRDEIWEVSKSNNPVKCET